VLLVLYPLKIYFGKKYNVLADALNPASPLISEFNTIAEITSNPPIISFVVFDYQNNSRSYSYEATVN
jgi:hypothetical protein